MSAHLKPRALAISLLCVLLASLILAAAQPASAIGPVITVDASPRSGTSTVTPEGVTSASYSATVQVYGGSQAPSNVLVTLTPTREWTVNPSQYVQPISGGTGHFTFNFTVTANESAVAGDVSQVDIVANYRVAGVTLASASSYVYTEAGRYYGATVKRVSAPEPMSPGNTYNVEFDVTNTGNSGINIEFDWLDPDLNSRLKADFVDPASLSVAAFENVTAVFKIRPQGTTPGGTFDIPVRARLTDRSGATYGVVNFTLSVEFSNLPYPGFLPRFDLHGPYTILSFIGALLFLWVLFNAGIALLQMKRYRDDDGSPFVNAFIARTKRSLVGGLMLRLIGRKKPKKRRAVKRPEELIRAKAERARPTTTRAATSREPPVRRGPSGKP